MIFPMRKKTRRLEMIRSIVLCEYILIFFFSSEATCSNAHDKETSPAERTRQQEHQRITNVHDDDIHGICVIENGGKEYVISGSKDTSVKCFDLSTGIVSSISPATGGYNKWVTAMDSFADGSVLVGHRNEYLQCFDPIKKKRFFGYPLRFQSRQGLCKERNQNRITGVKCLNLSDPYPEYSALVGKAGVFYHWNCSNSQLIGRYEFENPAEWVYGFSQLEGNSVVAIHGCNLSLLKFTIQNDEAGIPASQWQIQPWKISQRASKKINITAHPKRKNPHDHPPFISSVSSMGLKRVILSIFGGSTEVLDVETEKLLQVTDEHSGRVWQSLSYSDHEYISCADDRSVKIWDMRQSRSTRTFGDHPGRVSAIGLYGELCFVAGTCPDDPRASENKAEFYFYDIRMGLQGSGPVGGEQKCDSAGEDSVEIELSGRMQSLGIGMKLPLDGSDHENCKVGGEQKCDSAGEDSVELEHSRK